MKLLKGLPYSTGHYGKSLLWHTSEYLTAFYLAEAFHIPASKVGVLLFAFLIWDAITDSMIGFLIAKFARHTNHYLNIQLTGSTLSALAFSLFFMAPQDSAPSTLFAHALITGIAFRTAYTLYDLPQNALLKQIGKNSVEYTTLASLRNFFGGAASLSVAGASTLILSENESSNLTYYWFFTVIIMSIIAVASSLWVSFAYRRTKTFEEKKFRTKTVNVLSILSSLPRDYYILLTLVFTFSITSPLFSKLIPFFGKFVIINLNWSGVALIFMVLGIIFGQPLWIYFANHGVNRQISTVSLLMACIATLFILIAFDTIFFSLLASLLMGAGIGGINTILWSSIATVVHDSDIETQENSEGAAFGLFTFCSKIGLAINGLLVGLTLTISAEIGLERSVNTWILITAFSVVPTIGIAIVVWALRYSSLLDRKN